MEPRPIRLTVLQPNLAPIDVKQAGPLITLGRATDCTVPIRDRYLSRRHAEIIFEPANCQAQNASNSAT